MFYDDPASGNATINPALISRRARNFTDVIVETRTVDGAVEPYRITMHGKTYTVTKYLGCRYDPNLCATEHGIFIGKHRTLIWHADGRWFVQPR